MSDYHFPYKDALFNLQHVAGFQSICEKAGLDDLSDGLAEAVLSEAAKFGTEELAPLNVIGDRQGAVLKDGQVHETAGFAAAYEQFCAGGWPALTGDPKWGGQGLPALLSVAVNEVWQSANLSWALCPLLTQGAIEALTRHGTAQQQDFYLPKLISGEWVGTMNLTEADAGTDLAAIKTRAEPEGDAYRIYGQKIFITWGDHQMAENILHMVLARLPDAPAGVKGISLFLVPKFLLDEQGAMTQQRNDVFPLSLEEKMGIHGSPTCVMSYGEHGGALGYLVGGKHNGLSCMFTMMNDARQAVGLQGLAVAERAYQQAVSYAKSRLQGADSAGNRIAIIQHPDVRRMLMQMKAGTEAMRALAYVARAEADCLHHAPDDSSRTGHQARLDLYTPIVKGWLTEMAQELTSLSIQVHGGMGYIEETGVAQYYRDARILTIYEGTTGIQALDLIGRKTLSEDGQGLLMLFEEIDADLLVFNEIPELNDLVSRCHAALDAGLSARKWVLGHRENSAALGAVSVNYLLLLGYLCGGWLLCKSAFIAKQQLELETADRDFLQTKISTANFYAQHMLPRCSALLQTIQAGEEAVMEVDEALF